MKNNWNSSPKFSEEDIEKYTNSVSQILYSGKLILGEYTDKLEYLFSKFSTKKYAVAVSSATAALEIILKHINVRGKKVVIPANTFISTLYAIKNAGGIPVIVDIDYDSLSISIDDLCENIDENTCAVIVTHIAGIMCDSLPLLKSVCNKRGLYLIEDCSHSVGAYLENKPAGSFGYASIYSLYPTKIVTAGTGGVIVTDENSLYKKANLMRTHGVNSVGNCEELSSDWIISEFNALAAVIQMEKLKKIIEKRNFLAKLYVQYLKEFNVPGKFQDEYSSSSKTSSFYKFILKFESTNMTNLITNALSKEHVGVGKCYPFLLSEHHCVKNEFKNRSFPLAKKFIDNHIALPLNVDMTDTDIKNIVSHINKIIIR
ncbi:DegT/DnrJ/EryC1/StrS family aminotransferase [Planococcus halotolerans]|uniref:DegT/DnrJ/EryC1/StrS family aminotransferase n=1 Tax=Planococcus halotolerans TaxID=2233542 RepID=A0A365KJZ3_9BACL|nr:DegT/DnrJ/EryC1/StrS aminotransferase family protein [Planococcus halotolerans]RAZ73464.1 hypothetical protein DP120_17175 [Planococcus halotolerans]